MKSRPAPDRFEKLGKIIGTWPKVKKCSAIGIFFYG